MYIALPRFFKDLGKLCEKFYFNQYDKKFIKTIAMGK